MLFTKNDYPRILKVLRFFVVDKVFIAIMTCVKIDMRFFMIETLNFLKGFSLEK